ncbi:PEP motif-containing protein, putative exosortase substrate [Citrifermentans bemidjiense Bem]|uniref:PEP motif-containing protein, putative exosortase substrate n=1 Tax=Citrifermentans bemidjiense (strain ATCC BAA-1014 / DSM 16622 / JCM 12645 / Bem) TaxID=404380 RepID=B5EFC6_CITBB|nr:PEP-CTERM sorting domain-containing protein [Citrifermentans bemidjiense]ACH40881.1 PEP motif-containing protein, putative exosortase substrate [Citrifermentans bemidjiense Bem]
MKGFVVAVLLLTAASASATPLTVNQEMDLEELASAPEISQGLDTKTEFTEPGGTPDSYAPSVHIGASKLQPAGIQAPEPATIALLSLGFVGLFIARTINRRRSKKR